METIALKEQTSSELVPAETIEGVVRAMGERFCPERIVLFGSYASGRPTPDSDLDLLVIMDTDLPPHRRAAPLYMIFRPMPCPMDILVFTPVEVAKWNGTVNHVITEALSTGKVMYERHGV